MTDKIVNIQAAPVAGNQPTYTEVNAAVSTIDITAVSTQPGTDATVDLPNISVQLSGLGEESVPNDSLFKRNQDFADSSDQVKVKTYKAFIDLVSKTDTVTLLVNYKRTFTETKSTIEVKSFSIGKNLVELKTLQDSAAKRLEKVLADAISNSDTQSSLVGKNLVEAKTVQELVNLLMQKGLTDVAVTSDILTANIQYYRIFTDTVDATDDFYGTANIDDDQVARVGKNVVEYANFTDFAKFAASVAKLDTADASDAKSANFGKALTDASIISEIVNLAYGLQKQDQATSTDTKLLSFAKALLETSQTQDLAVKALGKVAIDTANASEELTKRFDKSAVDTGTIIETFTTAFSKLLEDLVDNLDTASLTIKPTKVEQIINSDEVSKTANKEIPETTTTSEQITKVASYYRTYTDTVDATDDFYGSANVDDDQIARVGKNVIEYLSFLDQPVFANSKTLQDTVTKSETFSKQFTKPFTDSVGKADQATVLLAKQLLEATNADDNFIRLVSYNRGPSETVASIDSAAKQLQKVLADLTSASETFTRLVNYIRIFADIANVSDTLSFSVTKVYADLTDAADTMAIEANKTSQDTTDATDTFDRTAQFYRTYLDTIDATDDFYGAANIDDDQIARVGKTLPELLSTADQMQFGTAKSATDTLALQNPIYKQVSRVTQDQFTRTDQLYNKPIKVNTNSVIAADVFSFNKTTNLPRLDSLTTSDSGVINNQSYFAGTFATPGYVGTNTIFT